MSGWTGRPLRWLGLALATLSPGPGLAQAPRSLGQLPGSLQVLAHRGASAEAPENTMAAFARAAELGVGFELDVTLCASGEVVVIHDDSVDRTTDGQGDVASLSLAEIKGLDAGSWHAPGFAGERIPTLDEVLGRFAGEVPIDIELKSLDARAHLAAAVVAAVRRADAVDQVLITSFDPYLLEAVRLLEPDLLRGQLTATFRDSALSPIEKLALRGMWLNGRSQPDAVAMEHVRIRPRHVRRMHRRGLELYAWTVNDLAEVERLLALGVDGVLTDRPREVLDQLAATAALDEEP